MPKHVAVKWQKNHIGCRFVRLFVFPKIYTKIISVLILDLRRLWCYPASTGNSLQTFREN